MVSCPNRYALLVKERTDIKGMNQTLSWLSTFDFLLLTVKYIKTDHSRFRLSGGIDMYTFDSG